MLTASLQLSALQGVWFDACLCQKPTPYEVSMSNVVLAALPCNIQGSCDVMMYQKHGSTYNTLLQHRSPTFIDDMAMSGSHELDTQTD